MTHLLISTVRRHIHHTEPSGYIYVVDLENQQVVRRCTMVEPAYRERDTNPRGGLRGTRGMAVRDDQIAIANAAVIFRYDPAWQLLGVITHPSCSAIHDILFQGDTLWATSASNDLLVQFDLNGKLLYHYYLRQPSPALAAMGWKPRQMINPNSIQRGDRDFRDPCINDKETFDQAHVNSVSALPDGNLLVSLGLVLNQRFITLLRMKRWLLEKGVWNTILAINRGIREALRIKKRMHSDLVVKPAEGMSAIVRISPDRVCTLSLLVNETTVPSHSLLRLSDGTVVYLNTTEGVVVHVDPLADQLLSRFKVTEGFLRGVMEYNPETLVLGSLGDLLIYNRKTKKVEQTIRVTDDPKESVYDIKTLPSHYTLPPESLEGQFGRIVGYDRNRVILDGAQ